MMSNRMMTTGGAVEDVPNRSLEFTAANSESLELSSANWGSYNRNKWAFSCWAQRKGDVTNDSLFSKYGSGTSNQEIEIRFDLFRAITVHTGNATTNGTISTTQYFSAGSGFEVGNWYHIYVTFDTSRAAADVLQLIVDGTRVTDITSETQPVGAVKTSTTLVRLGRQSEGSAAANAYIYQPAFFSGTIPTMGNLVSGGSPRDIRSVTGLYSLLHTTDASTLENDEVIGTNWTNNNTVVKSTTVP